MGQKQEKIHHSKKTETVEVKPNPEVVKKGEKLKKDIDDLLEKIDDVLEKDAEEFVEKYVQKGGE